LKKSFKGEIEPDSALLPLIASCNGNARDIVSAAVRVAVAARRLPA